jgi:uncharacterized protein
MKGLIILFVIIFAFLFGGINYYIGLRGWQNLWRHIPYLNNRIYWILFSIIAAGYILSMLLPSFVPSIITKTLNITGSYWLAIMFYLIMIIPIIDLIRLLNRNHAFIPRNLTDNASFPLIVTAVVITLLMGVMVYGTWSGRSTVVTNYNVAINKHADSLQSLKIIMVSDIHLSGVVDNHRLTYMVNRINSLRPDIVLIPGDIIDSRLEPFIREKMGDNFKRLKSKYGVYACLGNHDGMGSGVDDVVKCFDSAGIKVLRDRALLIDNSFYVIGRDDISLQSSTKVIRKDLSALTKDLDKSKPILLMDHQPRNLSDTEKHGIDLQVSGHTHRGQLFPANLITSRIFELDYGYLKKGSSNIIVSSGYGTWGPPIRIGSRSEIVEIDLKFNTKDTKGVSFLRN